MTGACSVETSSVWHGDSGLETDGGVVYMDCDTLTTTDPHKCRWITQYVLAHLCFIIIKEKQNHFSTYPTNPQEKLGLLCSRLSSITMLHSSEAHR